MMEVWDGQLAFAYYTPDTSIKPLIAYVVDSALHCEFLHHFHYVLHGQDKRPDDLVKNGIDHTWMIVGHDTPDDPLHYACYIDIDYPFVPPQPWYDDPISPEADRHTNGLNSAN